MSVSVTSVTAPARRPSIRRTLLVVSLSLAVLPSLILGGAGTLLGYQAQLRNTRGQLSAAVDLKQREIDRWVEEREADLSVLATETALQHSLRTMLRSPEGSSERLAAYSEAAVRLSGFLKKKVAFIELSLLDAETGVLLVSTEAEEEGTSHFEEAYFRQGREGPYLHPPVFDPTVNASTILIARPVSEAGGEVLAVLVGRANLADLGALIQAQVGLGRTVETYLVSKERFYLAGSHEVGAVPEGSITSAGIRTALSGMDGVGQYLNYQGEGVLGAYRWLPVLRVALLIEQSWSEALADALQQALTMVGLTAVAIAPAAGVALLLTRRIVDPIAELTEAATEIAAGDLERAAPMQRADEVGLLAQALNSMTAQLRDMIGSLEQRVAERTADLERRSAQLEAAAQIAREAAAIRDIDSLLTHTVSLISERFNFYHAGVFLLDEAGEHAVLRAASSEGGQHMLARGHKLKVGEVGIVGHVAHTARPRISLDVGEDAVFFDNPDLPLTRSEMALPLQVGERVIGVLDVQSTEAAAFSREDVAILQTMADQVALAIENAHLLEESEFALRELQMAHEERVRALWESQEELPVFEYDQVEVVESAPDFHPGIEQALRAGQVVMATEPDDGASSLIVPLRLRDQVIGAIGLEDRDAEEGQARLWTEEDIELVEAVSEQVAMALESARLFQGTQRAAWREQTAREIMTKVQAATGVEGILRVAVRELGRALGIQRAVVQLGIQEPARSASSGQAEPAGGEGGQQQSEQSGDVHGES